MLYYQVIMSAFIIFIMFCGAFLALERGPIITRDTSINTVIAMTMNKLTGAIYLMGSLISFVILWK